MCQKCLQQVLTHSKCVINASHWYCSCPSGRGAQGMVLPLEGEPPQVCGLGCLALLAPMALSVDREASLWGVQSQAPRSDTPAELTG